MKYGLLSAFCFVFLHSCAQQNTAAQKEATLETDSTAIISTDAEQSIINEKGTTIAERINVPQGFERAALHENSFAFYLRNLPLKPHGTEAKYFNGNTKSSYGVYDAVVDLNIGNKDLHQCADAVMRLRAEYLFQQKKFDDIHFNFTNGFRVDYNEWIKGKRIAVSGNNTKWVLSKNPSNTYKDFWEYMETIFTYAGTLSLSKELKSVDVKDMQIGDVFIQGGSPGHAVIVVDMATNAATGETLFLVAQSYMPAQEIQVLQNLSDSQISPWYSTEFGETLSTPQWTFKKTDLKRF